MISLRTTAATVALLAMVIPSAGRTAMTEPAITSTHVESADCALIDAAFHHGYTRLCVDEPVGDRMLGTLTIQSATEGRLAPNFTPGVPFAVWTRDLYWGFLGWAQAGDAEVLDRMRSSLELLILAMRNNQAYGQSEEFPLDDERFYVPQAWTPGLKTAMGFYPFDSESQADFVLLARDYWRLSGDLDFIRSIWADICYVTKTIEVLDTDGNSLPDRLSGSYDYQYMGRDTEEPLMCAKTVESYRAVAQLARELGRDAIAERYEPLAERVRQTMNRPVDEGGLWLPVSADGGGGHYVNSRSIRKGAEGLDARFIPYENIGPVFFDVPTREQEDAIYRHLDAGFDTYYDLKYGPMYTAGTVPLNDEASLYSSTPWLGFLDVYLRCRRGHEGRRSDIWQLLMDHAGAVRPDVPFAEGIGVNGTLTGGAGRSWDNGNYFHTLIVGIYGIEKSSAGVRITPPVPLKSAPVTELKNVRWRDAVIDFTWQGSGARLKEIRVDGETRGGPCAEFLLTEPTGHHTVIVVLGE